MGKYFCAIFFFIIMLVTGFITPESYAPGSFGYDLVFLKKHDNVIVLESNEGTSQVIVSPKYQGKVFTSTADGLNGHSFGWIHYKAFEGELDPHMNAYGGENRLWLGPEGGKFSLFFSKDAEMTFPNWKTPSSIDIESWQVTNQDSRFVNLEKDMQLTNYAGTPLSLHITRTVSILEKENISKMLHITLDNGIKAVGYQTINALTNTGNEEWTESTGMPCIWMLDMFNPSSSTVVVIPYKKDITDKKSKVATTDYFGEIPKDRVKLDNGLLFFKADGKSRGKLGINPMYAEPVAGSYDPQNKILTIALFDVDPKGKYLNQEWNTKKPPFSGDAVNAYNDGPLADGNQMGPFYEIESVSPAAFIKPGKSISHSHSVFHFTGNEKDIDAISRKLFKVSTKEISEALNSK